MDVRQNDFGWELQPMLEALCSAHFVSLDLEFSGISTRPNAQATTTGEGFSRKQSLQEKYEDIKVAAQDFQVLQVGFTMVREEMRGVYVVRPYNMYLNPLICKKIGIDRTFCFKSDAVQFLLNHSFSFDRLFAFGVPYLSRHEENIAIEREAAKADKANIPDIRLGSHEVQTIAFIDRARDEIRTWLAQEPRPANIEVGLNGHVNLNSLQKRLIHQLVRAEFPQLVAVSQTESGAMNITHMDKEREAQLAKDRKHRFNQKLHTQVGLRWLFEAMVGGNFQRMDPIPFINFGPDQPAAITLTEARGQFESLQSRLDGHPTVLVGHNIFTDLIYFYATFFGPLPDKVEDFAEAIHKMFPLVIDTKYMATRLDGDETTKSSLTDVEATVRHQDTPRIEGTMGFDKYEEYHPKHEAGYDSLVTARIAILLSAKLDACGAQYTIADDDYVSAQEDLDSDEDSSQSALMTFSDGEPSTSASVSTSDPSDQNKVKRRRRRPKKADKKKPRMAFGHAGQFDLLAGQYDMLTGDMSKVQVNNNSGTKTGIGNQASLGRRGAGERDNEPPLVPGFQHRPIGPLMPAFDSHFWKVYGNKLRVFGTQEGVCYIE